MRRVLRVLVFGILSTGQSGFAWGEELEIGSAAPKLAGLSWVKGAPIDLEAVKGRQITVVEFWATWCPPCIASIGHLSALQAKQTANHVRIVGVTQHREDNTLEKVTRFVERMGEKMNYTVAFDAKGDVVRAYMEAAGVEGIPTVFVVDQAGRVAWIGYPDEAMDAVVAELVAGSYDLDLAKQLARLDKRAEQAAMFGEWADVIKAMDEALALKPSSPDRWMQKFFVYSNFIENHDRAKECAQKAFELVKEDPDKTARFASGLIADEDAYGYNQIALEALSRARTLAPNNAEVRMAQFRALSVKGHRQEALTLAAETIDLLKGNAERLVRLAEVLSMAPPGKESSDLALRAAQSAIDAQPDEPQLYLTKFHIQRASAQDTAGAMATGYALIEKAAGDADFLNGFAWELLTDDATKGKFNQVALAAAEAMHRAPGGDGWSHLDTLALAKFENGAVAEAIELEKKAIAKCDSDTVRATLESALARFERSGN